MNNIPAADHPVEFVGGALALDFTNTVGGTHRAPNHEHLQHYDDLIDFVVQGGALPSAEGRRLKSEAGRHPVRAKEVLRRAIALREAMWRLFECTSDGRAVPTVDLAVVNREIAAAFAHARFLPTESNLFTWAWDQAPSLDRPLWPIAKSAADLLGSSEALAQLRECASDTCEWLFLDRSRNHTRRWCDMNDCGGRAKVRRFRARRRKSALEESNASRS
ncbi:MAG: CGNR zinc finger domain-containing protein [Candidatus Limnocylindria bacterium]